MTLSYTLTDTFTKTHASYLASKVAADLKQMQLFYGKPSDGKIIDFAKEVEVLLVNKCLKMVAYGFHENNSWTYVLRYTVRSDGITLADDRSGSVPPKANVEESPWLSFLEYSDVWFDLSEDEQQEILDSLPFRRTSGTEPDFGSGRWSYDKTYYKSGTALERGVYSI